MRRYSALIALAAALAAVVGIGAPTAAQEAPGRLDYTLDAKGWSVLNETGALVGASSVSVRVDETSTTVRSTPFDPGLVGAAGSLLSTVGGFPEGVIPAYPFYADAVAPPEETTEVGGTAPAGEGASAKGYFARSEARLDFGRGLATSTDAVVGAGNAETDVETSASRAEATGERKGTALSAMTEVVVRDVSLLGGTVTIDSIVTSIRLTWGDPTSKPQVVTSRRIEGAEVLGVPARITEEGIEVEQQGLRLPGSSDLTDVVSETGFVIRAGATTTSDGSASVEGVVLEQPDGDARTVIAATDLLFKARPRVAPAAAVGEEGDATIPAGGPVGDGPETVPVSEAGELPTAGVGDGGVSASDAAATQDEALLQDPSGSGLAQPVLNAFRYNFWLLTMVTLLASIAWLTSLLWPLIEDWLRPARVPVPQRASREP